MFPRSSHAKGVLGEEIARNYLRLQGYKILDVNFHTRSSEIDIIAQDDTTIVFIEVKSSTRESSFGDPIGWIPFWKQNRIIRASLVYLKAKGISEVPVRFDVITVNQEKKVLHVRDAFRAPYPFSV